MSEIRPKYSNESIIREFKTNKKLKFVFFWGHQPDKNGEIKKTCFSQWYISSFEYEGIEYFCMEQYMMAFKAKLFNDKEILDKIMKSKYQKEIKNLGRQVKNFNEDIWNKYKYSIVLKGNYAKFSQNEELRKFLLGTSNRVLVEASPYDGIWGVKMAATDESIEDPTTWQGENLLGYALMEVRDELEKVYKNY